MELINILVLGGIAGFTIYLGFPIVFWRGNGKTKAFLNAISVGVLLFIFVEMSYLLIEGIETKVKLSAVGMASTQDLWILVSIFIGGFLLSLMSLVFYEMRFVRCDGDEEPKPFNPRKMALLIALGIGLHNFSEGLVIGQEFIGGAMTLGYMLVVGFALHNATEGFGIISPMSGEKPSLKFILLLGLIGGGPTLVGTLVGTVYHSEYLSFFFLALASGAILYIIGELIHIGKLKAQHLATSTGLLAGFFLAFGSDMIIERASAVTSLQASVKTEVNIAMEEFKFVPDHVEIPENEPVKLVLENRGTVDHEIEMLGLPQKIEVELPPQKKTVVLLPPLKAGQYQFICDMPGHLMAGMKGELRVGKR